MSFSFTPFSRDISLFYSLFSCCLSLLLLFSHVLSLLFSCCLCLSICDYLIVSLTLSFSLSRCLCFSVSICLCFSISICLCFSLSLSVSVSLSLSVSVSLSLSLLSEIVIEVSYISIENFYIIYWFLYYCIISKYALNNLYWWGFARRSLKLKVEILQNTIIPSNLFCYKTNGLLYNQGQITHRISSKVLLYFILSRGLNLNEFGHSDRTRIGLSFKKSSDMDLVLLPWSE